MSIEAIIKGILIFGMFSNTIPSHWKCLIGTTNYSSEPPRIVRSLFFKGFAYIVSIIDIMKSRSSEVMSGSSILSSWAWK